jgi:twitching motility protein PilT
MARLDQLIGALVKHSAEYLVLADGSKPALVIDGTPRPIVKNQLDINQVRQLVVEVTPADQKDAVLSGQETTFLYGGGDAPVNVSVTPGEVVIRLYQADTPVAPPPAAAAPPIPVPHEAPAPAEPVAAAPQRKVEPLAEGSLTMDALFHMLVEQEGSDLHVSADCRPMLRLHGELVDLELLPVIDANSIEKILLEIAPERNREEFAERGDTDFAYEIAGLARFRCNLFRDRKGAGGVFRIIPNEILTADQLGLSEAIRKFCTLSKGLVLVTGPTGSGKSTTLAAMIDIINSTRPDHVLTIEDPIEFVHPNRKCLINQREVHRHTRSFKAALRAALREDPDVVLVGELRDLETVATALETAETGHLVLGTLHTNSAVSTVDRIIDQFPGDQQSRIRIMLSESLKGVVAQVLCRKIGGGRTAAHEILVVNAAVSNLIREGKTFQIPSIMQTGRSIGMLTMNDALVELVKEKTIEPEEAYVKAIDKQGIMTAFRSKQIKTDFLEREKAAQ